jgi:hypothetical protein
MLIKLGALLTLIAYMFILISSEVCDCRWLSFSVPNSLHHIVSSLVMSLRYLKEYDVNLVNFNLVHFSKNIQSVTECYFYVTHSLAALQIYQQ